MHIFLGINPWAFLTETLIYIYICYDHKNPSLRVHSYFGAVYQVHMLRYIYIYSQTQFVAWSQLKYIPRTNSLTNPTFIHSYTLTPTPPLKPFNHLLIINVPKIRSQIWKFITHSLIQLENLLIMGFEWNILWGMNLRPYYFIVNSSI